MTAPLLEIRDLHVWVSTSKGVVRPVQGVSLDVHEGEAVCLLGDTGSGKTMTILSALGLTGIEPGIVAGSVRFDSHDILEKARAYLHPKNGPLTGVRKNTRRFLNAQRHALKNIYGGEIGVVFQEPVSSLDPIRSVGDQLVAIIRKHVGLPKGEARDRAKEWLRRVGFVDGKFPPEKVYGSYPFELAGGMCQRALIAMALAGEPRLLIADEPTTALDATTQMRVLHTLNALRQESGTALLLITHDIRIAAALADRIVRMDRGRVMETFGCPGSDLDRLSECNEHTRELVQAARFEQVRSRKRNFSISPCNIGEIPINPPLQKGEKVGCPGLLRSHAQSVMRHGNV